MVHNQKRGLRYYTFSESIFQNIIEKSPDDLCENTYLAHTRLSLKRQNIWQLHKPESAPPTNG